MKDNILIIGALGQIGTELTEALRGIYGENHVVASDIVEKRNLKDFKGIYEHLNIMDKENLGQIIDKYKITQVYHLAAILSAKGEANPLFAWRLNMEGLLNLLTLAVEKPQIGRIFWPSSIAAFGVTTPRQNTPQYTVMEPTTAYGISKQAGERWAEYYWLTKKVDTRSIRYPGLISYKAMPGGGTTDYAVDIFHKALKNHAFECFLQAGTYLPMMYMPDALRATLELMHTDAENVKIRSSYNVGGMSFDPEEIAAEIRNHIPDFTMQYKPDFRQQIADSWPQSIDDTSARMDWGWKPQFDLPLMVEDMLSNLEKNHILKTMA
jgi:nucleoside-diphosphate-sugar epimerase